MLCKSYLTGRLGTVGFTLIELLVVVLIIGILAAIALPQYQKAVGRAQMIEGVRIIRTLAQSAERYHLATGSYPTTFADMDVEIPWTGTEQGWTPDNSEWVTDTRSNKDWSLQLYHSSAPGSGTTHLINITRLSGKYKGGVFRWFFADRFNPTSEPFFACTTILAGQGVQFNGTHADFCVKLMHGQSMGSTRPDHYLLDF